MIPIKNIIDSYFWSWLSLLTKLIITLILISIMFCQYSDKVLEILTLFAIFVAIFKESILNFYLPPRLSLEIAEKPNHYSEITATTPNGNKKTIAVMGIIVKNNGIGNAKSLKVLFNGLESNLIDNFNRYRTIPVLRSWYGRRDTTDLLPSRMSARYSLGGVSENEPNLFFFEFVETPNALYGIECQTRNPATFKFEIVVQVENGRTKQGVFEIEFPANYIQGLEIKSI